MKIKLITFAALVLFIISISEFKTDTKRPECKRYEIGHLNKYDYKECSHE